MSYSSRWIVAQDSTFIQRVAMSLVTQATNIASEAPATANHTNRANLAKAVVASPLVWAALFALGVVDNQALETAALAAALADASIDNSVSAIWNTYAGVI